jgi:hypothetical protein
MALAEQSKSPRTLSYGLFQEPWWLDAVAPNAWREITVHPGELISARWPIVESRSAGLQFIVPPPLTPWLGPVLDTGDAVKVSRRLEIEKELIEELLRKLPKYDKLAVHCHASFTNVLPFMWAGFRVTPRYTYVLDDLSDETRLWNGLRENIRREIRKARKQVEIVATEDIVESQRVIAKTFARIGVQSPHKLEIMQRIDAACSKRDCREILLARDEKGRVHSSLYLVRDAHTTYYLAGGADPQLRTSGAHSLMMWEAIRRAGAHTHRFDFVGSMLPNVERFFRAFGARQQSFYRLVSLGRLMKVLDAGYELALSVTGRDHARRLR